MTGQFGKNNRGDRNGQRPTVHGFFDFNRPLTLTFNLRMDPFERHDRQKADEISMRLDIAWGGQVRDAIAAPLATLKEFPLRQAGGSLTVQ